MTQDIIDRIAELDDLTVVKLIRRVGAMLFKDPEIRSLVQAFPPSAGFLATLMNLPAPRKQEVLAGERSIWLARELLVALAFQPRFRETLTGALSSLRGDELPAEASVPRGLATDIVRLLAAAHEAAAQVEGPAVRGESVPDPLVRLAQVALAPEGTPLPAHSLQQKPLPALELRSGGYFAPGSVDTAPSPRAWESVSAPDVCLNAWFPDQPEDATRLIVGVAARLCVNLGPSRAGAAVSETLPGDVLRQLCKVPFLDVLILCAGADIQPLRRRLLLPPDPGRVLEFTLVARRPGELEIQIVLLVHNEPIHRMRFPVTAVSRSDTVAAATGSQI